MMWCVVILGLTLGTIVSGEGCQCPDGWIIYRNSCYLFLDNITYSWVEAAHFCEFHHAHLPYVETKTENMFLEDHANRLYKNVNDRQNVGFWLGGQDDVVDGVWVWYKIDQPVQFTDWRFGEPHGHTSQNCLGIHGNTNFSWHDLGCADHFNFICEKE